MIQRKMLNGKNKRKKEKEAWTTSVTHLGSRIRRVQRPGKEGRPGRYVQDETFPPKGQETKFQLFAA